jgi:cell division protease FtsH
MALDSWIPIGMSLPNGSCIKSILYEGMGWQIYDAANEDQVLLASDSLIKEWKDLGLIDPSIFDSVLSGHGSVGVFCSPKDYIILPLESIPSPEDKIEAISFTTSLRLTRQLLPKGKLSDTLYVEKISRLLPVNSITPVLNDEMLLGRYLTGGVHVSVRSRRRLESLLPWLSSREFDEIYKEVSSIFIDKQIPENVEGSEEGVDGTVRETDGDIQGGGLERTDKFSLPGRYLLESFFNEFVIDILQNRDQYKKFDIGFPAPIVLHGAPGCGKTFAVDRLIDFLNWPCFSVDSSSVGSPYIHETSRKISDIFAKAFKASPSVLIIDEMESFLADRSLGGSSTTHHLEEVAEFLRRIPAAIEEEVLIIGMTNRIDLIDPAILRRGRFDNIIEVAIPSTKEIEELLLHLLKGIHCEEGIDIKGLVNDARLSSLADVAYLVREGARLAVREGYEKINHISLQKALERVGNPGDDESRERMGFL